jgi:hypothetical protein
MAPRIPQQYLTGKPRCRRGKKIKRSRRREEISSRFS